MLALRVALGVLLVIAAAIAVVPALVLFDLVSGGTGWGLCQTGLSSCNTGYFAAPELAVLLIVSLFIVLAGSAACLRGIRYLEKRKSTPMRR